MKSVLLPQLRFVHPIFSDLYPGALDNDDIERIVNDDDSLSEEEVVEQPQPPPRQANRPPPRSPGTPRRQVSVKILLRHPILNYLSRSLPTYELLKFQTIFLHSDPSQRAPPDAEEGPPFEEPLRERARALRLDRRGGFRPRRGVRRQGHRPRLEIALQDAIRGWQQERSCKCLDHL